MSEEFVRNVFDWKHFLLYLSGPIDNYREGGEKWRQEWIKGLVGIGIKPEHILNPCDKPLHDGIKQAAFNLNDEAAIMNKHRSRKEWKELCRVVGQIAHVDLRMCDKSDLVLVNFPCYSQMAFLETTRSFESHMDKLTEFIHALKLIPDQLDKIIPMIGHLTRDYYGLLQQSSQHRIPTYGTLHEIVVAHLQRKPIFIVWEGGKTTCSAWLMWLVGHNHVFETFEELQTRLKNISKGKTAYNAKEWLLLDFETE